VPLERTIGVAVMADALLSRAAIAFLDVLRSVSGWRSISAARSPAAESRQI